MKIAAFATLLLAPTALGKQVRRALIQECEKRDCDRDSDCSGSHLLCTEEYKEQLLDLRFDPQTANCFNLSSDSAEVCFDYRKISGFQLPVDECDGGCVFDSQCSGNLVCTANYRDFLRDRNYSSQSAYCSSTGRDTCFDLSKVSSTRIGEDNFRFGAGTLGECEVDCDQDSDCGPGLVCADVREAQLGSWDLDRDTAYCREDPQFSGRVYRDDHEVCFDAFKAQNWRINSRRFSNDFLRSTGSLGECEIDCDQDSDCGPGLVCADVREAQLEAWDLDRDTAYCREDPQFSGRDYRDDHEVCFDAFKAQNWRLNRRGKRIGFNNNDFLRSTGSLGECEIDCDQDSDCGPGLVCADVREAQLEAWDLDRDTAYCREDPQFSGRNYRDDHEVCYDPFKAQNWRINRRGQFKSGFP